MSGRRPARWLTPASGYLTGYSHTLNPYVGCAYGCSYCYVRRMPVGLFHHEAPWGEWVNVKRFERAFFIREWERALDKGTVTLFMSSSTDPYQPAEAHHQVARSLLETMAERPPAFVMLQTRGPLVVRDIDLLRRLGRRVRVSMTIETDMEAARRHFTPSAPPLAARWRALQELQRHGVPTQVAVAPLLPHTSQFADWLAERAERVVVDDFFRGDGRAGQRSAQLGMREACAAFGDPEAYDPASAEALYAALTERLGEARVSFSQAGFLPPDEEARRPEPPPIS
ncbi:radical SAM protein [Paenibacillus sp. IB182496]|uniref:Radical SAM protein n=1 Tax=Paenibacillus sabuli TaxID=2772509 RepID=A0A927BV64_9BACL|nr:radical SAM protein [Paenibacillus sabuli]